MGGIQYFCRIKCTDVQLVLFDGGENVLSDSGWNRAEFVIDIKCIFDMQR